MDRATLTAEGRLSLSAEVRRRHGLVDRLISRAQEISARLTSGRAGASVDDFLIDRWR
ncbi:MAG TPA: hypothetical protein VG166_00755 [Caulobacteraceae bacterium]|jgi:hypothetical protein|nr:hypothetical protein [Caulobacteraceae bacterium]